MANWDPGGDGDRCGLLRLGGIFLIHGLLCLFSAMYFNANVEDVLKDTLPKTGGITKPFEVHSPDTVLRVAIRQDIDLRCSRTKCSNFVTAKLLDSNKRFVMGFEEVLFTEQGPNRNSDHFDFSIMLTFQEAGTYYFEIESESGSSLPEIYSSFRVASASGDLEINATRKRGSGLIFLWLGVLSSITGVALIWLRLIRYELDDSRSGSIEPATMDTSYPELGALMKFGILGALLLALYLIALPLSMRGWGYHGYDGFHHPGSFIYIGSRSTFHEDGVRGSH